jgi:flagellar P-ring protein precursor FlgI
MKLDCMISQAAKRTIPFFVLTICAAASVLPPYAVAGETDRQVMVRDITSVEGVRENMLVGYGLVVGLRGTGDRQQTIFTVQTLANAMQKMGVLISPSTVVVKNVAAVSLLPRCLRSRGRARSWTSRSPRLAMRRAWRAACC